MQGLTCQSTGRPQAQLAVPSVATLPQPPVIGGVRRPATHAMAFASHEEYFATVAPDVRLQLESIRVPAP